MLRSFFGKSEGQGAVEYGLLLIVIFILIIGLLNFVDAKVDPVFSQIDSSLTNN